MRQSITRDALRRIEDIVAQATGKALSAETQAQIESVLDRLIGATATGPAGENFAEREVTILLADLRGFTALTATYPAGLVLDLLNRCFVSMSEIIVRHRGTIDKFMGDSIMVIFFGDRAVPADDVRRALDCALDMQLGMEALNSGQRKAGTPELFMGIGINTGKVMAGLIGSDLYSAYTVIGEEVNLASRIEAFSLRGQILMSEGTYRHAGDYARAGEPVEVYVKGRAERVQVRELLAIPSRGQEVPRQEVRRSPRAEVRLPFSYQLLNGKIVLPDKHPGVVLDIGYHGLLAESGAEDLELYAEVKLELYLPLVAFRAEDLYARVVKVVRRGGARPLVGLEFTSVSAAANRQIQLFVQMLIQGSR
jgi:adenylate cyclase